jgi:hypothetical protein
VGLDKMLGRLTSVGGPIAVIGDGPVPRLSGLDPGACIARQQADFTPCRAQRSSAVRPAVHDLDRTIAASHGAAFLDPTPWLCDQEWCPAVIDRSVVYVDGNGHLTATFMLSLADRLVAALPFPT